MAMNNTSTRKQGSLEQRGKLAGKTLPTKDVNYKDRHSVNDGQMRGNAQPDKFAEPMNDGTSAAISGGIDRLYDDIGEKSGFITDGYLDKGGTPYGEAAKFNFLPPGMDISNQENAEIHSMPLRKLTEESYPGDGWMPKPRDIEE
jgi:hypothetical protein